jgi:hypothetical protein
MQAVSRVGIAAMKNLLPFFEHCFYFSACDETLAKQTDPERSPLYSVVAGIIAIS